MNQLTLQCALLSIALVLDVYLEAHFFLIGDIYKSSSVPVTQQLPAGPSPMTMTSNTAT